YIPELAAVHGQGATVYEAKAALAEALDLILEANRGNAEETFARAKILRRENIHCTPVARRGSGMGRR
ncbi:MAG TPA: hypothetical protein VEP28_01090, partial [Rubrobacter sp.]|nr:hypothetical protein [Rubrobacter sp.]